MLLSKKKTSDKLSSGVSSAYRQWHDKLVQAVRLAMPPEEPYTVVHVGDMVGVSWTSIALPQVGNWRGIILSSSSPASLSKREKPIDYEISRWLRSRLEWEDDMAIKERFYLVRFSHYFSPLASETHAFDDRFRYWWYIALFHQRSSRRRTLSLPTTKSRSSRYSRRQSILLESRIIFFRCILSRSKRYERVWSRTDYLERWSQLSSLFPFYSSSPPVHKTDQSFQTLT